MATTDEVEQATTLARSHLRWVKVPGRGRTCVRIYDGPPGARTVMLLHGWAFTADTNWWPSYAALARHYRVVALDHCGHGLGLQGQGRFEFERCADDVAAVAAGLGLTDAVVAGYSMGGPIALMTARRHPELVAGLVLCATSLDFSSSLRDRFLGHAASAS